MALIIKCRGCGQRIPEKQNSCAACGTVEFCFTVDYWPDGRYGKRVRLPLPDDITDRYEAVAIEREFRLANRARQKPEEPAIKGRTVNQLFPQYLEWYEMHRSKTTYHDLDLVWRNQISPKLGNERVDSLNSHHVVLYQRLRRATKVGNRTINKELDYFSGFLRWCEEYAQIPRPEIKIKRLPYKRPLPIVLSVEEIVEIIRHSSLFYRCLFLCLYTIGLRSAEARRLRWDDIDFANAMVRVLQKGGEPRLKPINRWLLEMLTELRAHQAAEAKLPAPTGKRKRHPNKEGWIFFSPLTGNQICLMRKPLNKAAQAAGITKRVYPHLFRHSFATHLMARGTNLSIIQDALSHREQSTTAFYTHVAQENLRNAISPLMGENQISRLQENSSGR